MADDFSLDKALTWNEALRAFPWLSEIKVGNGLMTEMIYNKQLSREKNSETPDGAEGYIPVSHYGKAFLTRKFFKDLLRLGPTQ